MTAFLVTLLLFPIVGRASARALRMQLPTTRTSRFALFFLLGLGVQGSFLYVLGALHVPLTWVVHVIPVVVAICAGGWRVTGGGKNEQRIGLSTIVFALPLLVMFVAAAIMPTRDYDGRVTWLPKARAIAIEGSIDGAFFHGERGLNLHNRYPLLVPLDVATVMKLSGDTDNETGRWLYVFIAIAMLVVLRAYLRAWFETTGAWISAGLAWLPLLTTIEGGALAAYNDFAIAAFIGVAVLSLINDDARTAGVFAAFAILAKNEGAPLAIAILVAAIVTRRFRWPMLIPIALAEAMVVYARKLVPPAYDEQYEVLMSELPRSFGRVPEAMNAIAKLAGDFREWALFWFAVAAAIVIGAFVAREKRFAIPLITLLLGIAAYIAALTVTSWSIADLAPVAVNRLLAQLLVPASVIFTTVVHALSRTR